MFSRRELLESLECSYYNDGLEAHVDVYLPDPGTLCIKFKRDGMDQVLYIWELTPAGSVTG